MGPKKGMNSKAESAKDKKEQAKQVEKVKKAKQEEDAAWAAAGDGAKSKAQAKKDEQAKQRDEAAAKKLEAKKMAEEEEASLSNAKPKAKAAAPKMTSFQLALQREAAKKEKEKEEAERKKHQTREVDVDAYESSLAGRNTNKGEENTLEARSVGQALSALELKDDKEVDLHPERRRKAAFEAYQERELAELRQEKPGLKQSQYKEMIFKAWQKSPENPMNCAQ